MNIIEKKGYPISELVDSRGDRRLVYLDPDNTDNKRSYKTTEGKFYPIPRLKRNDRECLFVTGPSGSGKSTYVAKYIERFRKIFPKRRIIIFSKVEDDPALDIYNPIRIEINNELIENPIKPEELEKSLVIFDDIDTISDNKLKDAVHKIKDDALQIGRHYQIYVVVTSHICKNHNKTKINLIESHSFTFFPSSGSIAGPKSIMKDYIGLDKKTIERILESGKNSRWVTIYTHFPQFVMTEKEIYLLSNI